MIEWKKRAKVKTLMTGSVTRSYESRCGHYRVVELKSKWFPTKWLACHRKDEDSSEGIISKHRKQAPAKASCEKHAKAAAREAAKPKRKKRKKKDDEDRLAA